MDALKIVPQAFFDAIARVVPGFVALFLLAWFEPHAWAALTDIQVRMLGGKAPDWSFLFLLGAAYTVGHLMTPGTKLVQRITERYPKVKPKAKENIKLNPGDTQVADAKVAWWRSWTSLNTKKEAKGLKPNSEHYDWLRVNSLDAAGLAAKLRAEFTMYNSLAFTFVSFAAWLCLAHRAPVLGLFLVLLGIFMASRGRETQETMRDCVERFYVAAGGP